MIIHGGVEGANIPMEAHSLAPLGTASDSGGRTVLQHRFAYGKIIGPFWSIFKGAVLRRSRSSGDSSELRKRLVDAATLLLVEHGLEGLSLRRIAAMADASTMAIYSTFGSKDGLVDAVFEEAFQRLLQYQERAGKLADSVLRLHGLVKAARRYAIENPSYYDLVMRVILTRGDQVGGRRDRLGVPAAKSHQFAYLRLLDTVKACCADGCMAESSDPALLADSIWATVHGLCSIELAGYYSSRKAGEARFDFTMNALYHSLMSAEGRSRLP